MRSNIPPIELIHYATERLGDLCDRVTFLGGSVLGLLITDPAARPPRTTDDVDVAIDIASRLDYNQFEIELRQRGFQNALEGPTCRFVAHPLILDVMPTDPNILGFSNPWYSAAISSADRMTLANGLTINLISPACFIATKFAAFDSPDRENSRDLISSRGFEDIVSLLDGRSTIESDVRGTEPELQNYLISRFKDLLASPILEFGISAHLDPDSASQGRIPEILQRIESISRF